MVIPRSLLFKGLGLCTLCGGVGVAIHQKDNIASLLSSNSSSKITRGNLECEEPTQQGGNCTIKEKIFVKKKSGDPFQLTSLGDGKIKVYKVEGEEYNDDFKFLIEDNDIAATGDKKLEEFESYEIKLGTNTDGDTLNGNYYLLQKTDSRGGIKKALGLPDASCDLPTTNTPQTCDISNDKLGKIKFKGGTGATISGGTVTLTISKESTKTEFPLGYKFTFKNTNDADSTLTIGSTSITLKKNSPVDFKINKNGSSLSLEKAWTLEELAKKVGLKKENDDYWTVGDGGLNVKQNETKETGKTKNGSPTGKIRLHEGSQGYNEGLKFEIEKGDFDLNKNGGTITVLSQFESYEIIKDGDNWYLTRKEGDQARIKELLGLQCELPTTKTPQVCDISNGKIGTIKFTGAGDGTVTSTGQPKLTIAKDDYRSLYPMGYKFTFTSEAEDSSISPPSSTSITLKKGLSIDYKIKISGENNDSLSLEKAWTPESLMELVSLNKNGDAWVLEGGGASIKQGTNKSSNATANGNNSAKIRVYEGVPGYNQGMKFVVEEGNTSLDGDNNISQLSKYETYEVSKNSDDGNYYFTRKKKSDESIRELLGLPESCSMPAERATNPTECDLNVTALGGVKFEGKGDTGTTSITDSGSVTLSISKVTGNNNEFPLGYKFTFTSEQAGFTIPKNGSENITIKKNTNTEFKIKVGDRSNLTLEKAWTVESLGEKVKLSCSGSSCSFGDNINVYENDSSYVNEASITNSTNKTLTYELDQENYNQGIKFYVDGGEDINLNGGNGPSGSGTTISTISKKNGSGTTYEIAQKTVGESTKWYLVKK